MFWVGSMSYYVMWGEKKWPTQNISLNITLSYSLSSLRTTHLEDVTSDKHTHKYKGRHTHEYKGLHSCIHSRPSFSLSLLFHTRTSFLILSLSHTSTDTPLSQKPSPITHRSHWPDKEGFSLQKFFEANIFNRPIHVYGGNRPAETLGFLSLPPHFSFLFPLIFHIPSLSLLLPHSLFHFPPETTARPCGERWGAGVEYHFQEI